jgi:aspartate kinase
MSTLVMKFGGTSTGKVFALNRAVDLVIAQIDQWDRIVVVVSAMEGVTDLLIECAELARTMDEAAFKVNIEQLRSKLEGVVRIIFAGDQYYQLLMDLIDRRILELTIICQRIRLQGKTNPQEMDEVAALGERINVHVFSAVLCKRGILSQAIEATRLIITDDCYQAATPIQTATNARVHDVLSPLFAKNTIPVVTGFIGATPNGATTTLGRGGSDYTAAILGKSLDADEIWIWTDVDGIMTADPNIAPTARLIPEISYNEIYELAYFGAKVLHPKTILPASEANIPLWVKNTFNQISRGTKISHSPKLDKYRISAVTGLLKTSLITVRIKPVRDVSNFEAHIQEALTKRGVSILAIFQARHERSLSFAFTDKNSKLAIQFFKQDLSLYSIGNAFSQIQLTDNLTIISIIGREICRSSHVLSRVYKSLKKAGIKVNFVGHGTSPDSLVFLIKNREGALAIKHIHDEIIINEPLIPLKTQPVLEHLSAI